METTLAKGLSPQSVRSGQSVSFALSGDVRGTHSHWKLLRDRKTKNRMPQRTRPLMTSSDQPHFYKPAADKHTGVLLGVLIPNLVEKELLVGTEKPHHEGYVQSCLSEVAGCSDSPYAQTSVT